MDLFNQFKNSLNEKFNSYHVAGTGKLALRPGDYFIHDIEFREIGIKTEVPIAKVNWVVNNSTPFLEDHIFEVAVGCLFPQNEFLKTNLMALKGTSIFVYRASLLNQEGIPPFLRVEWGYHALKPSFINQETLAAYLFFGSANTLSEAWNNHEQTAGYDINEVLGYEATKASDLEIAMCEAETAGEYYTEDTDDIDGLDGDDGNGEDCSEDEEIDAK